MKNLVGIHVIAASLLLTAIPCASEVTPPWTFQVMADWHGAEWYAAHPVPGDDEVFYNLQKDGLLNIREEFGGDLVVMPGDTNSGNWNIQSWVDKNFPGHSIQDAVYKAGINCYSTVRNLFTEAGYEKILISIGDHELGDNYWGPHGKDTKTDSLTQFRSSFTTALYMDRDSGEHIYKEGIGNADSTPIGTPYEYTSFAHRHKNALFITMDVFHEISDQDFLDRVNGIGGEGIITGDVTGSHLDWFEEVLKEARNDDGIKHIIVQSHLPILQPVRKIYSSAMFFDRAEHSPFWKKMVEYGVDIYLAGEVHAHTASKTDESDLVQIVSKSLGFFNFLQVTVTDDSIRVDAINEVGPEIDMRKKSEYEVFGSLIIDKSSQDETKITSDGELKLLDIGKPLLRFDFEETHSLNERQILGMFTSKSLLPKKIAMHGRDLYDCIHNHGIFGQQYDAPVADVEIVEGGINGNAGKFNGGSSQLGVYAFGPAVGGYIMSYSIWFKTTKSGELILVHSGQAWSKTQTRENIFTLTLNNGIPTVYANKSSTLKAIDVAPLNDGGWHQVAVSMHRLSSPLSKVKLYIDGKDTSTSVHLDMELFFVNYSRISIGSLGFTSTTEADFPNWSSFHGLIDEVYLWARPIWPFDLRKSPRKKFGRIEKWCENMAANGMKTKVIEVAKKPLKKCKKKCKRDVACMGFKIVRPVDNARGSVECILFKGRKPQATGDAAKQRQICYSS